MEQPEPEVRREPGQQEDDRILHRGQREVNDDERLQTSINHGRRPPDRTPIVPGRRRGATFRPRPSIRRLRPSNVRRDPRMTSFRVACRSLARRPGFTFIATLTLAVGIAATTTVFSV